MKALSVREPFATMIMNGEKSIETRTWKTHHRGDLLICVTKKPVQSLSGKAICIVNITNVRRMETCKDWQDANCVPYPFAYGWFFTNVRKIKPFNVTGKLSLFEVKHKIEVIE